MKIVLVTDHPAPTVEIEAAALAEIGARLLVAETGEEEELVQLVPQADAILTCFKLVTTKVVRAGDRLKVIGRYGVGVDNIAVEAATENGILVTNVPVYCVDEVAEHAIALWLTLARKSAAYDASIRAGEWRLDLGMPIHRIAGSTLGILGFGNIGRAVVMRAKAFGCHVVVHDPNAPADAIRAMGAEPMSLDGVLTVSDVVTIHVPLVEATRHLINADRLALMKPSAFLVNCARGAIVDLDALATALQSNRLAGAGIDVFEPERLPVDHPLLGLRNTVLTPHVAFYSEESISELQKRAVENVVAVLTGNQPANVVNSPSWRRRKEARS